MRTNTASEHAGALGSTRNAITLAELEQVGGNFARSDKKFRDFLQSKQQRQNALHESVHYSTLGDNSFVQDDELLLNEFMPRVEVEDELARYRPHILATSCETPPEPQQPSIRRSHSAMQFAKRGAHNEI